jgi:O-methyltransferase
VSTPAGPTRRKQPGQTIRERALRSGVATGRFAMRLRAAVRAWRAPTAPTGDGARPDLPPEFMTLYERCAPFTMTSIERMYALYEALRYISAAAIEGDVVECGVWRGGSSMMAALTLAELGIVRRLWLYDTFEGMPPPGAHDIRYTGEHAHESLDPTQRVAGASNDWAWATINDVTSNMRSTGHRELELVAGKVENTIPARAPATIALLRLDTDWYESTRHELEYLYPRLTPGGVLIVDDYGHWQGAKRAVDEYFRTRPILLNRIDYTGRIAVKPN